MTQPATKMLICCI